MNRRIEELGLTVRSYTCLRRAGIYTLGELMTKSKGELVKVRNLGAKSLKEIMEKLEHFKNNPSELTQNLELNSNAIITLNINIEKLENMIYERIVNSISNYEINKLIDKAVNKAVAEFVQEKIMKKGFEL